MIYLSALVAVIVVLVIVAPFWWGKGGRLQSGSALGSRTELLSFQNAIIARYQDDQSLFKRGEISRTAWEKRQTFLLNRYVDLARRLDVMASEEEGAR